MEDIDEKILESIPWSKNKYIYLYNIDHMINRLENRINTVPPTRKSRHKLSLSMPNILYELEHLRRIRKLVDEDAYEEYMFDKIEDGILPESLSDMCMSYVYSKELELDVWLNGAIEKFDKLPIYELTLESLRLRRKVYDPTRVLNINEANFSEQRHLVLSKGERIMTHLDVNIPAIFYDKFLNEGYLTHLFVHIINRPDNYIPLDEAITKFLKEGWICSPPYTRGDIKRSNFILYHPCLMPHIIIDIYFSFAYKYTYLT